jgi:hypothetical protein
MVTLHLLEYLKQKGFGTAIDTDLFFESFPMDKNGLAIYSVGGERPYGARGKSQMFELESKGDSNLTGMNNLEKIAEHFASSFSLGELPIVPDMSNRKYTNGRILGMSNIQNIGKDANERVIYKITARIIYKKEG